MDITAMNLQNMSIDELEMLYKNMPVPTKAQKKRAWKNMDTGIYDEKGQLIGDLSEDEDSY